MSALAVNPRPHQFGRRRIAPDNAAMHRKRRATPLGLLMDAYNKGEGIGDNELARAVGVPQSTITRIASGETKDAKEATLRKIADFFNVSTAALRGLEPLKTIGKKPAPKYFYPKAYENVVAGKGSGRFNEEPHIEIEGVVAVPLALIRDRGWRPERLRVVATDGLSMYPTLGEDEPVVVNLDESKLVSGKVYAIEDSDEGLRIKRLYRQNDGRIRVVCDNPDKLHFPDDYITPESNTRIVARVVYRSGEL